MSLGETALQPIPCLPGYSQLYCHQKVKMMLCAQDVLEVNTVQIVLLSEVDDRLDEVCDVVLGRYVV